MKHKTNDYEIFWADYCKVISDVCPNAWDCEECKREYENTESISAQK